MKFNPSKVQLIPPAFAWWTQAIQYTPKDVPGIRYFAGPTEHGDVDCLLYYGPDNSLWGILNYYGFDVPHLEKKGSVNIFINPTYKGIGIATQLLNEARKRWTIDFDKQRYTSEGFEFIKAYLVKNP